MAIIRAHKTHGMGLFDFLKNGKNGNGHAGDFDPTRDLTLSRLKKGFLVDYDLDTWTVTDAWVYDFGDDEKGYEWQLTSASGKIYLSRYEDDEVEWTVGKKIPIGALKPNVRQTIIKTDEPPDEIQYEGETYYLDESGTGHELEGGKQGDPFIFWTFEDSSGDKFVSIEQWGETEFEASAGKYVEEYQFSNILPGS